MPAAEPAARAVFIDRDGTLIVERNYLSNPDDVAFVPGAVDALRLLKANGFRIIVVTNQSGIARGLYSLADYRRVEKRVEDLLAQQGVMLDAVYFCPHHPDVDGACECRKPGLGMYRNAAREHHIDLANSIYIGDRLKDVLPAQQLGGHGILVRTGYGREESGGLPADMEIADDLSAAASLILKKNRTAT